jgi:hypothetical protein
MQIARRHAGIGQPGWMNNPPRAAHIPAPICKFASLSGNYSLTMVEAASAPVGQIGTVSYSHSGGLIVSRRPEIGNMTEPGNMSRLVFAAFQQKREMHRNPI